MINEVANKRKVIPLWSELILWAAETVGIVVGVEWILQMLLSFNSDVRSLRYLFTHIEDFIEVPLQGFSCKKGRYRS